MIGLIAIGLEIDDKTGPAGQKARMSSAASHQFRRLLKRGGFMKPDI